MGISHDALEEAARSLSNVLLKGLVGLLVSCPNYNVSPTSSTKSLCKLGLFSLCGSHKQDLFNNVSHTPPPSMTTVCPKVKLAELEQQENPKFLRVGPIMFAYR